MKHATNKWTNMIFRGRCQDSSGQLSTVHYVHWLNFLYFCFMNAVQLMRSRYIPLTASHHEYLIFFCFSLFLLRYFLITNCVTVAQRHWWQAIFLFICLLCWHRHILMFVCSFCVFSSPFRFRPFSLQIVVFFMHQHQHQHPDIIWRSKLICLMWN